MTLKTHFDWPDTSAFDRPTVIRVALRTDTTYLTFATPETPAARRKYRYCIVGTPYGVLHNAAGDRRFWRSESGARAALRRLFPAGA